MEGIPGSLRVLSRSSSSSSSSSSLAPPLPSLSLLPASAASAPPFTSNNIAHPGGKISILTSTSSSASSLSFPGPTSSLPSTSSGHTSMPTPAAVDSSAALGSSVEGGLGGAASENNGVLVVGAIGRAEEVSQLLNRLLDAQVFGGKGGASKACSFFTEKARPFSILEELGSQDGKFADSILQSDLFLNGKPLSSGLEERLNREGQIGVVNEPIKLKRRDKVQGKSSGDLKGFSTGNLRNHSDQGSEGRELDGRSKPTNGETTDDYRKRKEWLKGCLSYYHDEEQGVVYVQFAWGSLPAQWLQEAATMEGLPSLLEKSEASSLRGLLFMFSVCHVILLVQDGVRFDTRLLRTFRILQNAKHILAPFVKTQVLSGLAPSSSATGRSSLLRSVPPSTSNSPGRNNVIGRNASTISLMSGSAPSLFPGQCTPVLLFVFLEDFFDASVSSSHPSSHCEDGFDFSGSTSSQAASGSQSIIATHMLRPTLQTKASNPVVMLARPTNKSEGGLRKKLQSSVEAQIRFLVKKCRILSGSGDAVPGVGSGMGPRGPGSSVGSISGILGGSALFVLDTSRAVCLLDRGTNHKGEALNAAIGVMEEMLRGKEVGDNALLDLTGTPAEDIQALKDFLWRQAEILRGRGGILSNSTGGSVGVGMVAAAAAAAAASAAAGTSGGLGGSVKPLGNPPELPSMLIWLSACQILVEALANGESQATEEIESGMLAKAAQGSRASSRKGFPEVIHASLVGKDFLGATLGCLECGMGLETKFSAAWCKRVLPSALEVYLNGLPPCYPTSLHNSQLQKALRAFQMMVRGPAVHMYAENLKEECEAVWKSGRQLCDAISLTGKPCIHQVHDVLQHATRRKPSAISGRGSVDRNHEKETCSLNEHQSIVKPHSSGVVFLHACACGRSRKLRNDPFDYESANVMFSQFPNCEDLLPSLDIPNCNGNKSLGGLAWSLVRLGSARYYQPSVGLLQSGFCSKEKFLSPWVLSFDDSGELVQGIKGVPASFCQQEFPTQASYVQAASTALLNVPVQSKPKTPSQSDQRVGPQAKAAVPEKQNKMTDKLQPDESKSVTRKGVGLALEGRRAFVDAVKVNFEGDSGFPPLQQKHQGHQSGVVSGKNVRQTGVKDKDLLQSTQAEQHTVWKTELVVAIPEKTPESHAAASQEDVTAGKAASSSISSERSQTRARGDNVMLYVGFEHECPYGHRFLLSSEHLEQFCSPFVQNEEPSAKVAQKIEKPGVPINQMKHNHKVLKNTSNLVASYKSVIPAIVQEALGSDSRSSPLEVKFAGSVQCKFIDEGFGEGYKLLNTNLPLYMNCPYCSNASVRRKKNSLTFAGTISQLQRIFVVTPPLPLLLSTCPMVHFEGPCVLGVGKQNEFSHEFSLGCSVVLPPESFLSLRLPFVYSAEVEGGCRQPLLCKSEQPERTAWLLKGSTLKIVSKDDSAANA